MLYEICLDGQVVATIDSFDSEKQIIDDFCNHNMISKDGVTVNPINNYRCNEVKTIMSGKAVKH